MLAGKLLAATVVRGQLWWRDEPRTAGRCGRDFVERALCCVGAYSFAVPIDDGTLLDDGTSIRYSRNDKRSFFEGPSLCGLMSGGLAASWHRNAEPNPHLRLGLEIWRLQLSDEVVCGAGASRAR
jgi:hypothetical protein